MSAFDSRKNTYTDTTVCPDLVDVEVYGHHKSKVVSEDSGIKRRLWEFDDEAGLKMFIEGAKNGGFRRERE